MRLHAIAAQGASSHRVMDRKLFMTPSSPLSRQYPPSQLSKVPNTLSMSMAITGLGRAPTSLDTFAILKIGLSGGSLASRLIGMEGHSAESASRTRLQVKIDRPEDFSMFSSPVPTQRTGPRWHSGKLRRVACRNPLLIKKKDDKQRNRNRALTARTQIAPSPEQVVDVYSVPTGSQNQRVVKACAQLPLRSCFKTAPGQLEMPTSPLSV